MRIANFANNFVNDRRCVRAQRRAIRIIGGIIKAIFLFGFCFVILYPIITMLLNTFMDKVDLSDNSVLYIPRHFTLINLKAAAITLRYGEALKNTGIITLLTTAIQVMTCMLTGYGFARHDFKFKNLLFELVIFSVIIPPMLFSIPYFHTFLDFDPIKLCTLIFGKPLNLLNTYYPFMFLAGTCMGIKNGIFIYLFRQAFKGLPMELEEAGTIDGATSPGIFFKIMVPNTVTMIVTVVLFSIVWQYNDVTFTRTFFISEPSLSSAYSSLYTMLPEVKELLGYSLNDVAAGSYGPILKSAGTFLIMAPLLIFYSFAQKYFVEGVARAGIVG